MIVLPNKDNSIIDVILGDSGWTVQQIGRKLQFTSVQSAIRPTGTKLSFDAPDHWGHRWGWNIRPDGLGVTLWNEKVHQPNSHAKHSEYLARLTASEYAEEQAARFSQFGGGVEDCSARYFWAIRQRRGHA